MFDEEYLEWDNATNKCQELGAKPKSKARSMAKPKSKAKLQCAQLRRHALTINQQSHVLTIYYRGASLFDKYVRSDNCIRQLHT